MPSLTNSNCAADGVRNRLALHRKSLLARRLLSQGNLSITPADESWELPLARVNPLRQLPRNYSVGLLALVETLDELRSLGGTAADVEGPTDQGTELVLVEGDFAADHFGDAFLEFLS